jgi:anthranilate synthase component 2
MAKVLVLDNYDSFTWNLVHLVGPLVGSVEVVRNDEVLAEDLAARGPDAIIISPGPCTPNEAGISLEVVRRVSRRIPTLGVCLGMQAMGQAFGGTVVRAPSPRHGKVDVIHHAGRTLFQGIEGPFRATRYHSLVVRRDTVPPDLEITAETADGLVMGVSHRTLPIHGVQFHPESVMSEHGRVIMLNFLALAEAWSARDKAGTAVH